MRVQQYVLAFVVLFWQDPILYTSFFCRFFGGIPSPLRLSFLVVFWRGRIPYILVFVVFFGRAPSRVRVGLCRAYFGGPRPVYVLAFVGSPAVRLGFCRFFCGDHPVYVFVFVACIFWIPSRICLGFCRFLRGISSPKQLGLSFFLWDPIPCTSWLMRSFLFWDPVPNAFWFSSHVFSEPRPAYALAFVCVCFFCLWGPIPSTSLFLSFFFLGGAPSPIRLSFCRFVLGAPIPSRIRVGLCRAYFGDPSAIPNLIGLLFDLGTHLLYVLAFVFFFYCGRDPIPYAFWLSSFLAGPHPLYVLFSWSEPLYALFFLCGIPSLIFLYFFFTFRKLRNRGEGVGWHSVLRLPQSAAPQPVDRCPPPGPGGLVFCGGRFPGAAPALVPAALHWRLRLLRKGRAGREEGVAEAAHARAASVQAPA